MGLFPYIGGDSRIAQRLVNLLPAGDLLIEAFGGAGSVALEASRHRLYPQIILNDLDVNIYDSFRLIKHHPQSIGLIQAILNRLVKVIEEAPRQILKQYLKQIRDDLRAGKMAYPLNGIWNIVLHHVCHVPYKSGLMLRWTDNTNRYNYVHKHLLERHRLLKRIDLMNVDAFTLLQDHDDPKTVAYIDPPHMLYNGYYRLSFTPEDAMRLDELLRSLSMKIMIKLSEADLPYYKLTRLWRKITIPYTPSNKPTTNTDERRRYHIYMNYRGNGLME